MPGAGEEDDVMGKMFSWRATAQRWRLALLTALSVSLAASPAAYADPSPVHPGPDGKLVYDGYANVVFSSIFDPETAGEAPRGWTIAETGSGSSARVTAVPSANDKSLEIKKSATPGVASAVRSFRPQSGRVYAAWTFNDTAGGGLAVKLGGGATDAVSLSLRAADGGHTLAYEDSSGVWQSVYAYALNAWNAVELEADTATHTFALRVNGLTVGTGLAMRHAVEALDTLSFAMETGAAGRTLVDNVRVDEGRMDNRLIDFSYTGYGGGGVALPEPPVQATLEPVTGDNAALIQAAIDSVSTLTPDANGFRGAVLLKRGVYEVSRSLRLHTSGVVLRGEGQGSDGTVLRFATAYQDDLIKVSAAEDLQVAASRIAAYSGVSAVYDTYRTYAYASGLRSGDGLKLYSGVRLDDKRYVQLLYASDTAASDGVLTLREGSPTGAVIGQMDITPTGGPELWVSRNIPIDSASVSADVYASFSSASGGPLMNVQSFALLKDTIRYEAENYTSQSGFTVNVGASGSYVTATSGGGWLHYAHVNLNGAVSVNVTLKPEEAGGKGFIEARRGSPDGELLGRIALPAEADGWSNVMIPIRSIPGAHELYLALAPETPGASAVHVDYFSLGRVPYGELTGTRQALVDDDVPTGAVSFQVEDGSGFAAGDPVIVMQQYTDAWAEEIGMAAYEPDPWYGSRYTYTFERRVAAVSGNTLTVDQPLVNPIRQAHSRAYVYKYAPAKLTNVGVERLRLLSEFASATDENHGQYGIAFSNAENGWVRNVTSSYFMKGLVSLTDTRHVTVQDSADLAPRSIVVGARRYPIFIYGQSSNNLFQRCYAEDGRHSFGTSARVPGPNVFLDSLAVASRDDSGPHNNYALASLYDNVSGGTLRVWQRPSEHGWSGAQHVLWNVYGDGGVAWLGEPGEIKLDSAPGTKSFAFGAAGALTGGGAWVSPGAPVTPRSLYLQQLKDRLGQSAVDAVTVGSQRDGTVLEQLKAWRGGYNADHPASFPAVIGDSFDALAPGVLPPGWGWGKVAPVVEAMPSAANRSLRVGNGTTQFSLGRLFAPKAGLATIQWKMMSPDAAKYAFIHIGNHNLEQAITLTLGGSAISYTTAQGASQRLQNIASGVWYTVRLEIDVPSQQYHIYVDDELLLANVPFLTPLTELNSLTFQSSSNVPGILYLDDVAVTEPSLSFRDEFQPQAVGQKPTGWTITEQADTSGRIAAIPYPYDASLRLADANGNGAAIASRSFAPISGRFAAKWRFMDPDGGKWFYFQMRSGTTEAIVVSTQPGPDGSRLMVQDGSGAWRLVDTYKAGRWYEVRIVGDASAGTFDVDVDGVRKVSGAPFKQPVASVNQFYMKSSHAYTGTTMYVDSVQVDSAPASTVSRLVYADFNAMPVDAPPKGWAVTATGGATALVKAVPDAANRSVQLRDESAAGDVRLSRTFGEQSGPFTAEWSFQDTGTGKYTYMQLNSGTTAGITLHTRPSGSVQQLVYVDSANAQQVLQSYQLNAWYNVKLAVRPAQQRYDIYINGALKAADVPYTNASVPSLNNLYFKTSTTGSGATLYIDNVVVERN